MQIIVISQRVAPDSLEHMKKEEIKVWKSGRENVFIRDGYEVVPPENWMFVPSGDPGLTRRLKNASGYWLVVRKHKNRIVSTGLLTDAAEVEKQKLMLEKERSSPAYLRKAASAKRSRNLKQLEYEIEFRNAVISFLDFHESYKELAKRLAKAVTEHAVPVGSGTVARTSTISIERRVEAAVIAWMRHKTTAYDNMSIARIKGERREVRRRLAERSRKLLDDYRIGKFIPPDECILSKNC